MNTKSRTANRYRALLLAIGFVASAALGRAEVTINLQAVTDAAGSSGNTFDVTLTNTGPGAIGVAGFSFGLEVGTSNLSFTSVTTSTTTAPYIFGADSVFGPDISVQPPNLPGQTIEAEDISASGGSTIGSGVTVGLGEVTFNLSPGTQSGGIQLSFIPVDDSLSDEAGAAIAFSAVNGSVTVTGGTTATPEPATFGFVCTAFIVLLGAFHLRRRAMQLSASAGLASKQ